MLKPISEAVQPNAITSSTMSTPSTSTPSSTASSLPKMPTSSDIPKPSTSPVAGNANVSVKASDIKSKVGKAVSESADLIAALECVGAMYGIPASNIIADPDATGIRVNNDNIIAPPISAKNQTKPIVQAVGSVLDYISQRIDDKLNAYQLDNIEQGRIEDSIKNNANPMKGKVIGRYEDDEGGEILAYDTGLVDMPNTDAARAKVTELRASNTIPTFDPNIGSKKPGDEYFNDEDDISDGVEMEASSTEAADKLELEENDIAKNIQESAYHVRMCAKLGDTTHLGYDLLQKHGFDFVKPIDSIVMEASTDDDSKSKKKVKTTDIKYMKFDNKNILKAVDYFNTARENQENSNKLNLKEFFNDPNFDKAVDCLNKQFDCRINLRMIETKPGNYENAATQIYREIKKNLTISKSKGFQLGGAPIEIFVYNHYLESSSPNDIELFGQTMVSTICHEIFHNIASVIRYNNAQAGMSLTMTLSLAAAAKTPKDKRTIITNYVDTLDELSGNKFIDKAAKKKLIKQLIAVSVIENNEDAAKAVGNSDKYINDLIKKYKKIAYANSPSAKRYIFPTIMTAAGVLCIVLGPSAAIGGGIAASALGGMWIMSRGAIDLALIDVANKYGSAKLYEEYFCDLFAGMYKLPKFFFVGPSKNKYVANDFSTEQLKELAKAEAQCHKALFTRYPTALERSHAGVTIAKQLLEQKDLEPQVKKYCQWVVDNFSSVHNTDIKTIYNKTTFDPKEAENLDKHLEDLIKDNNITLTESFQQWINSDEEIY